jgi:hypothetical protein
MGRTKTDKEMHVIGDAAHPLGNSIRRADYSAKIGVQFPAP